MSTAQAASHQVVAAWRDAGARQASRGRAGPFAAARADGEAQLGRLGWPSRRHEGWRHTPAAALAAMAELPCGTEAAKPEALAAAAAYVAAHAVAGPRVVLLDGEVIGLPKGAGAVQVRPLSPSPHLGRLAGAGRLPTAALNSALLEVGLEITIDGAMAADQALQLFFLSSGAATQAHPRVVVVARPGSRAAMVEHHATLGDAATPAGWVNLVSECFVADRAHLQHITVHSARHRVVGHLLAEVGQAASLDAAVVQLGAIWTRHEVHVALSAPGASTRLRGASVGRGRDHQDLQLSVRHQAPRTSSDQVFHACLDDRAVGVFAGRVDVLPGASGTEAAQLSRSLLLGPAACAHTQPHMEILTDAVRCSHGATVGELDHEALFFLQSRGIAAEVARNLLAHAFVATGLAGLPASPSVTACQTRLRGLFGLVDDGLEGGFS